MRCLFSLFFLVPLLCSLVRFSFGFLFRFLLRFPAPSGTSLFYTCRPPQQQDWRLAKCPVLSGSWESCRNTCWRCSLHPVWSLSDQLTYWTVWSCSEDLLPVLSQEKHPTHPLPAMNNVFMTLLCFLKNLFTDFSLMFVTVKAMMLWLFARVSKLKRTALSVNPSLACKGAPLRSIVCGAEDVLRVALFAFTVRRLIFPNTVAGFCPFLLFTGS